MAAKKRIVHSRIRRVREWALFFARKVRPVCYFCSMPLSPEFFRLGNSSDRVTIHHVDHDRSNNRIENLVPVHRSCHARYHRNVQSSREIEMDSSAEVGEIVSEGTHRALDLVSAFDSFLESHDEGYWDSALSAEAEQTLDKLIELGEESWIGAGMQDEVTGLIDALDSRLHELAPEGCHFGAHEGDGACFGFWRNQDDEDALGCFLEKFDVPQEA